MFFTSDFVSIRGAIKQRLPGGESEAVEGHHHRGPITLQIECTVEQAVSAWQPC